MKLLASVMSFTAMLVGASLEFHTWWILIIGSAIETILVEMEDQ